MGTDPLLGKSWRLGISPWRIGFCWDLQRFKICSEPSCWVGWFKPAYPAISAIGPQNQSKPVKANWPVTGYWKRAAWVAALNPNDAHVRAQPHQLPFPIGIIPAREHWPWSHKQPRPDLWSKSTSCPCRVPSLDVKNPWILGLDEAETLCFYMCLHLCKHESRLKRGRKKCKNRYEGDPEYLPFIHFWEWSVCSQLSGQSMNVCVHVFGLMVLDTLVINKSWHSRWAYPKSQVSSEKWSMNQLWYFWGNLFLDKTTRCGFTIPSSSVPSAEQHETFLTKDCQQSMHHWVIPHGGCLAKCLGECWRHHKSMDLLILLIVELPLPWTHPSLWNQHPAEERPFFLVLIKPLESLILTHWHLQPLMWCWKIDRRSSSEKNGTDFGQYGIYGIDLCIYVWVCACVKHLEPVRIVSRCFKMAWGYLDILGVIMFATRG